MKFLFSLLAIFMVLGISPLRAQDLDSLGFEDDNEERLYDLEEELVNMSLLQQESRAQRSIEEIEEETAQVQHLYNKLAAEIAVLQDENKMLTQKIEKYTSQSDEIRRRVTQLNHDNEMLLSENDDLLDANEASAEDNDEISILHNLEAISENEKQLGTFEEKLKDLEAQIQDAEANSEENEDTIEKHQELMETCEWVISTNAKLLESLEP